MVDADCVLIVFVVTQALDAFVFLRVCRAFFKLVTSCAEEADFLSSAVASFVIKSGAFMAPGSNHIVLYFAYLPSEFYLLVQQQFSSLGTHFHYQIPIVFTFFVMNLAFVSPYLKLTSVFCAKCFLYVSDRYFLSNIDDNYSRVPQLVSCSFQFTIAFGVCPSLVPLVLFYC